MADRVAVFNAGRIVQVGPPEEIYYRPAVPFVADFVGSSNLLPAALTGAGSLAALRPEAVRLADAGVAATVTAVSFLGSACRVTLDAAGTRVTALLGKAAAKPMVGAQVYLEWDAADLHVMQGA